MKALKTIATITLGLLFVGCRSLQPDAPEILVQETEIPDQPVSLIKIPIKIDLAPYFKATNTAVPREFKGKEEQCEGTSFQYYFVRKPIEFVGKGKSINFGIDGRYWIKVNYCLECTTLFSNGGNCIVPRVYTSCGVGEDMPKMHVSYKSTIGMTDNYR